MDCGRHEVLSDGQYFLGEVAACQLRLATLQLAFAAGQLAGLFVQLAPQTFEFFPLPVEKRAQLARSAVQLGQRAFDLLPIRRQFCQIGRHKFSLLMEAERPRQAAIGLLAKENVGQRVSGGKKTAPDKALGVRRWASGTRKILHLRA